METKNRTKYNDWRGKNRDTAWKQDYEISPITSENARDIALITTSRKKIDDDGFDKFIFLEPSFTNKMRSDIRAIVRSGLLMTKKGYKGYDKVLETINKIINIADPMYSDDRHQLYFVNDTIFIIIDDKNIAASKEDLENLKRGIY